MGVIKMRGAYLKLRSLGVTEIWVDRLGGYDNAAEIDQLTWPQKFWFYNAILRPAILKAMKENSWVKLKVSDK